MVGSGQNFKAENKAVKQHPFEAHIDERLTAIDMANLRRVRRPLTSAQGVVVSVGGAEKLNFCSNDYLGLANHPALKSALAEAAAQYGVGSGASSLVCGYSDAHFQLEQALAAFTGRDRALLFNTGFQLNASAIPALLGKRGALFCDALNHASLIDGARLAKRPLHIYPHANMQALEAMLAASSEPVKLIVSDAVFSMDGDSAPLAELAELSARYQAWLLVDDAHGLGVLGPQGRGSLAAAGLNQQQVPLLMGAFGKAFGAAGSFVAGPEQAIELLLQTCRGQIFSTAMPPALAAVLRESLRLIEGGDALRQQLHSNIAYFRSAAQQLGIDVLPSNTAIQPLLLGSEKRALAVSAALWRSGLWVGAIRPPTVPVGTARLRITLSAVHNRAQIDQLVDGLCSALKCFPAEP